MAVAPLLLFNKYCIDASALIDFWSEESYPVALFPNLRAKIIEGFEKGSIVSTIAVYHEINYLDNEVYKALGKFKNSFIEVDAAQLIVLKQIFNKYTKLATISKTEADPFLIACAKARNLTVVTAEKRSVSASPVAPKIPNLADEFSVNCMTVNEFFIDLGLKFSS